jgi:hypothetical protein
MNYSTTRPGVYPLINQRSNYAALHGKAGLLHSDGYGNRINSVIQVMIQEKSMRYRLLICFVLAFSLFVTACQGPPPTQIVLVVTATMTDTPDPNATAEATNTADTQQATEEVTQMVTTATPAATATIDPFPTSTLSQIQVAEQVFEHGRMMWIQPRSQIWVMIDDGSGGGTWTVYQDTFQEGEPESDPNLTVPAGMFQPMRGFGKLWRENRAVGDGLGLGTTPEFGYVSNYEYHPGGTVNAQNQYVPGPGYHILFSLYQEKFQFNEADGTWKKL